MIFLTAALLSEVLLVSGYNSDSIHQYDAVTGVDMGTLGPVGAIAGAQSLRYSDDGRLVVPVEKEGRIAQFDAATGAPLMDLVADDPLTPGDESGGLLNPTSAVFGPNGDLYVGDFSANRVARYDGATGEFKGVFVDAGSGGLSGPDAGMVFGPDGSLFVPSFNNNQILRFDGEDGSDLGVFASAVDGLSRPRCLRFRSDGVLFVSSWGNNRIVSFALDGTPLGTVVSTLRPTGFDFEPGTGDLIVTTDQVSRVLRYDVDSGALLGQIVDPMSTSLDGATWLEYSPNPRLITERFQPGAAGQLNSFGVRGGPASSTILLLLGFATTSIELEFCQPVYLGTANPTLIPWSTDAAGEVNLSFFIDASLSGLGLVFQSYDPFDCRLSNLQVQTL